MPKLSNFLNNSQFHSFLLSALVLINIIVCPTLFGATFLELLKQAQKGDHESIFKLIQIDKSLIG
jgi:hypothetical protein